MGSLCQKLPPEHSYEQHLIKATPSKNKNKNNISSSINIHYRTESIIKCQTSPSNSSKSAIYDRIQYTTFGIFQQRCNMDNDNYRSPEQFVDNPQLELHRIITIGYMTSTNTDMPLCIIDLCRKYYFALQPLRRKRVIFTSIVHLSLCIHTIPRYIMDDSLFFFKINKNQLKQLFNQHVDVQSAAYSDSKQIETDNLFSFIKDLPPLFIHYLKQKYDNNLLLILDEYTSWSAISKQIASIPDTWYSSRCKYSPLILENAYWNDMVDIDCKYDVTSADILQEIRTGVLKYSPTMEILWQSNPTLIPMKLFDLRQYQLHTGHNQQYIAMNTKTHNINTVAGAVQPYMLEASYYNGSNLMKPPAPCDADLVVLSVYNSGNDISEYSRTSYCYDMEQSYTAQLPEDGRGLKLYDPCDIDRAFLNWLKLYDDKNNINMKNNIGALSNAPVHSTTSGCNLCVNYHKFVQNNTF